MRLVTLYIFLTGISLTISWLVLHFIRKRNRRSAFQPEKFDIVNFHDEKGTLRLSIKLCNLYYIESSDNYVNIYYENKGKITSFLLRRSMKSIEDNYTDYPLVRCHRTYIVNVNKVKVLRNDKDGVFLDLDYLDLPDIPISKTYSEQVLRLFNQ